jgi:hypothetical protein
VPFQCPPVFDALDTSPQLLCDYHTEIFKRRKKSMELLEYLVGCRIAKGVDEYVNTLCPLRGKVARK